ncbi:hypothetical protein [Methylosinus sp. KRF6]|uniref:hypothetical protein n=1 Tax=Methylosinus sp. KRF6 TaxID=2846853 RepID=UPI001C0ABA78|nr:hypothetical protein [Methylosinus sp. KRF6]MBU3890835.1 hypothetical protein [Methylosinus sp. KRF6]
MIEVGAKSAGTPWVLRLDDDEFPSRGLLNWAKEYSEFRRSPGLVDLSPRIELARR